MIRADVVRLLAWIKAQMTEERTDEWVGAIMEHAPLPVWVPRFVVRKVLDAALPGVALAALEKIAASVAE